MTLHVLIHRQTQSEPSTGTLRAFVIQGTKRGENLLGRLKFTSVDSAVQHCDGVILDRYKLMEPPEINYQVEDYTATSPK